MRATERKRPGRAAIRHCRDAIGLLTEYMEGGLTPAGIRRLERHLAGCPACDDFLGTLRKTRDAARSLRATAVPGDCQKALRSLLKNRRGRKRA